MIKSILSRNFFGSFKNNPFIIGTSNLNEYIPVYTFFQEDRHGDINIEHLPESNMDKYLCVKLGNGTYMYNKPFNNASTDTSNWDCTTYAQLLQYLSESVKPSIYTYIFNEYRYNLNVMKGYISDSEDNILLLLGTNKFEIFENYNDLNVENLRLYVSTELLFNEKYKNFYKKLYSEYITACYTKGIEVVFTTSLKIESKVYRNNFEINFETISELQNHLTNLNAQSVLDFIYLPEPLYPNITRDELEETITQIFDDLPF